MINITSNLLTINPAFNESIIEFSSDTISGATYAEIIIDGVLNPFKVYPINNSFNFNFKPIITALINQNNFEDVLIPSLDYSPESYVLIDNTLSYQLTVALKVYDNATFDSTAVTYQFLKNAEQLIGYYPKADIDKDVLILLPTLNKTDYYLPMFEGYPLDFGIFGINEGDSYYLKNTTSITTSTTYIGATSNDVKRFFLSDGSNVSDPIGLSNTLNKVELWVNDEFKSNIYINKNESECGVYLKWFNTESGSYSYWLFDSVYSENQTYKTIDTINGAYGNLQNITSTDNITGKNGAVSYNLKTNFKDEHKTYLQSILSSPKVEMYIHQSPFNVTGDKKFIGVTVVDGSQSFSNKTSNNALSITIILPSTVTATL